MKKDLKEDKERIKRLLDKWHKSGKDREVSFVEWLEAQERREVNNEE